MLFVMPRFVLLACVLGVTASAVAQEPESTSETEAEQSAEAEAEVAEVEVAEPDPDAVEARMRFELGSNFYTQGRFAEALVEFGRSFELSGEPRLLHNMYLCERDAGRTAEAAGYLRRYLDRTGPDIENRQLLESRVQTLEERVAREDELRRQRELPPEPPNRTPSIILFAMGGVALAAAGGLALHVNALHGDLQDACYGVRCPEHLTGDRETLRRRAIAVDVLWAAGLAISVTGVLAWVLAIPDERPVVVSCGLSQCSVEGRF